VYKVLGIFVISAVALVMYGYANDVTLTPLEKINLAYPLSEVSKEKESDFRLAAAGNTAILSAFDKKYADAIRTRALTCSSSVEIYQFDSVKHVKEMDIDKECLKKEEDKLGDIVGFSYLAHMLSLPAKREAFMHSKTIMYRGKHHVASSFKSGIAVMSERTKPDEYYSFDLNADKKISELPTWVGTYKNEIKFSPNGRVLAVPGYKTTRFIDLETGRYIWLSKGISEVYAWLPEVNALLVKVTRINYRSNYSYNKLLDLSTGSFVDYEYGSSVISWAIPTKNSKSLLVGDFNNGYSQAFLVRHSRDEDGLLKYRSVEHYALSNNNIQYSGRGPKLVLGGDGLLLETRPRDILLYHFKQRRGQLLNVKELLSDPDILKVDESNVLIKLKIKEESGRHFSLWALDLKTMKIRSVLNLESSPGHIVGLGDQLGYGIVNGGGFRFGGKLSLSPVSEHLQVKIAKIKEERERQYHLERERQKEYVRKNPPTIYRNKDGSKIIYKEGVPFKLRSITQPRPIKPESKSYSGGKNQVIGPK
jgi:WD40 repeat protein